MALQLFLNELSFPTDNCAEAVAVERLRAFTKTLQATEDLGVPVILNGSLPLAELSFGAEWPLALMRNLPGCAEERIFLKTMKDRAPFALAVGELGGPPLEEIEYLGAAGLPFATQAARGLGLAHQYQGLAVSIASDVLWDERNFDLDRQSLSIDGDLLQERVTARNASSPGAYSEHRPGLADALRPTVESGADLWARKAALFPNLNFIERTRHQIEDLGVGHVDLQPLFEKLLGLERAVAHWAKSDSAQPTYGFFVRNESRSRLDRGLVDFNITHNRVGRFSAHADFGYNEGRLHFLLETQPERSALIGHAARKIGIG